MIIALGCDHAGYPLREKVLADLERKGIKVIDHGCYSGEEVDFPDIAKKVCDSVLQKEADRGIMLCGSGVGAAIACNKIPGIRAACCHDIYTARQCVEHDDVNVIALGADVVGPQAACDLIERYLGSVFSGGEDFERRIQKLSQMEKTLRTSKAVKDTA